MANIRVSAKSEEPKKRPARMKQTVPGASAFKGGLREFLRESWIEVTRKTTWPTRPELIRSTSIVLAVVVAVSLYLAFWDLVGRLFTGLLFKT